MIKRFLDLVSLLGLALLVSYLANSGKLSLLINPRYQLFTAFASACLMLGAGWTLVRGHLLLRTQAHTLSALLIMVVVFASMIIPLQSLSSDTALSRGIETRVPTIDEIKYTEALNTPSSERMLTQWVRILTQYPDPRFFIGQKVDLEGMVVKTESFPEGTFMLARFVVSCCIADARPLGLLVKTPSIDQLENSQWLHVHGTITMGEYNGQQRGFIDAEIVEPISTPDNPYEFEY